MVNYHGHGKDNYLTGLYERKPEKDTYKMYDIAKKITGYSKAPDSGSGRSWEDSTGSM